MSVRLMYNNTIVATQNGTLPILITPTILQVTSLTPFPIPLQTTRTQVPYTLLFSDISMLACVNNNGNSAFVACEAISDPILLNAPTGASVNQTVTIYA